MLPATEVLDSHIELRRTVAVRAIGRDHPHDQAISSIPTPGLNSVVSHPPIPVTPLTPHIQGITSHLLIGRHRPKVETRPACNDCRVPAAHNTVPQVFSRRDPGAHIPICILYPP